MSSHGFDFSSPANIDFNIDFDEWPPSKEFLGHLRSQFSEVFVYDPDEHGGGYVRIVVNALVTYDLVMFVQKSVSEIAAPFGGICESWGVLH